MKELEAEVRRDVERIFEEKRRKLGVEAKLELGFLDHTPIVGKNVYGQAFPFERPPRVHIEVFATDATTREITEIVCEELLHIRHPELSEEEIGRMVPACVEDKAIDVQSDLHKVKSVPIVVQAKAEVSYPWSVELFPKKEVPEDFRDMPIFSRSTEGYEELEEFLKLGQTDEEDVVNEQLNMGGDAADIAYMAHFLLGVDIPGEILKTSEKFREGEDYTDEEYEKVEEWVRGLPSFIFKWDQADVRWTPEAEKARDVTGRKYRYDELMTFGRFTRKDIDFIARVKGLSTGGRMEDVAQRIHSFDIGEEEVKSKLTEIEKLLG